MVVAMSRKILVEYVCVCVCVGCLGRDIQFIILCSRAVVLCIFVGVGYRMKMLWRIELQVV